jgi:hypothetical protein
LFSGILWGTPDSLVRLLLEAKGLAYDGGITADDKHTSRLSCTVSLRPPDVSELVFNPDTIALRLCMTAPVRFAVFRGRILKPLDEVNAWFDEERDLVRLIVRTKAYSLDEAERDFTDIRASFLAKYGPPVADSTTNSRDILLASSWWDSIGNSLDVRLQESNFGRLAGPAEYETVGDFSSALWAAFQSRRRAAGVASFR